MIYHINDFIQFVFDKGKIGLIVLDTNEKPQILISSRYDDLGFIDDVIGHRLDKFLYYGNKLIDGKNTRIYPNFTYNEITSSYKKGDQKGFSTQKFNDKINTPQDCLRTKFKNFGINTKKFIYLIEIF